MKAAVILAPNTTPVYADFPAPVAKEGRELITVTASALTHLTKSRASGAHYSSDNAFPAAVGTDGVGVTEAGRRVYFAMPDSPFGAMAEQTIVRARQCIDVPEELDDVTAAALANPGMSAWAALMDRAKFQPGETVLINGATGIAGRLAVQIAKHLGAKKVIATGRDAVALEALKSIGADFVLPFKLGDPDGREAFEGALVAFFTEGVDVVVDYLWGETAEILLMAIAKGVDDARPVRFVQVGAVSGDDIRLPSAALRSSSVMLMGSGLKSVPFDRLLDAIKNVFAAAVPAKLQIAVKAVSLADVESLWNDEGKARIVFLPSHPLP